MNIKEAHRKTEHQEKPNTEKAVQQATSIRGAKTSTNWRQREMGHLWTTAKKKKVLIF